jgi:hypothetical protein
MGLYEDFGEALPQEKREAFKAAVAALDGAVKIDSREVAEKLVKDNQYLKSAWDAAVSKAVENHDEKFRAEKLPGLLEAEIKKREPPPKDPVLAAMKAEIDAMKADKEKIAAETRREKQLARVIPRLTDMGLDADLADRLIGNTDDETDGLLGTFEKSFTKARDGYTERILKERFGNQITPLRGTVAEPTDLQAQYTKALADGDADRALVLQGQLQAQAGRK